MPGARDCYGGSTFEPLDPFFLTGSIHVSGLRLVTGPDFPGTPYLGFAGFTVEIYNAAHSTVIFSQMLSPALDATTPNGTVILKASISGLTLGAGSYWAGFIAPVLGVPGFSGGNGGLIDTTPHTGSPLFALGGNTGYELLGAVPEPEPWALLIGGFALAGAALRRRRGRFAPA
jgi:hypothetical protein